MTNIVTYNRIHNMSLPTLSPTLPPQSANPMAGAATAGFNRTSTHSSTSSTTSTQNATANVIDDTPSILPAINFEDDRFPYCIVWTPIPVLTWFFPMIGHMGICMSNGVIRDFAGPYYVSEDNMGFGRPVRFLRLHPKNVTGGRYDWDEAVSKASVLYSTRMHNLFCDNCHSHVATALCGMRYKQNTSWNMFILAFWMFFCGRYVSVLGVIKTWLPFLLILTACIVLGVYF